MASARSPRLSVFFATLGATPAPPAAVPRAAARGLLPPAVWLPTGVWLPAIVWFAGCLWLSAAHAQLPATRLDSLVPMSGQVGQTVEVTLSGVDLDDVQSLVFSHPGLKAAPKMAEPGPFDDGPQAVPNQFVVTVAGNVPVGRYEVRAVGKYGSSNPHSFFVSTLPTAAEVEPNQDAETATEISLPADVSGQFAAAGDVDWFRITPEAPGRLILDAYARRADSQADAVVVVYDAQGREIGNSRDGQRGDPLVDFNVAAGQTYTIKVYDAAFRGGTDFGYRFTVGALPHIDYLFPPAAAGGGNRPFTIYGRNLPAGQNAGLTIDGMPLQKQQVNIPLNANPAELPRMYVDPASGGVHAVPFRLKNQVGWSNAVLAGVATEPAVNEQEPNNSAAQAQVISLPCEIMGQFFPRRDADWYQFEATEGETLALEVLSQRQGLDTDASIVLQRLVPAKEEGEPASTETVALVTETPLADASPEFPADSRDPVHTFQVPATGTYRILVRDRENALRSDPRHIYRLAIRPARPDFELVAVPSHSYHSVLLRKGGQVAVRVVAFRRDGFDGEIRVTASGLPAGVTCSDAVIGPDSHGAALVLTAAANVKTGAAPLNVMGTAQVAGSNVQRKARCGSAVDPLPPRPNMNVPQLPASGRLADDLVLSVSADEEAPVNLRAGGGKVWETSRGGILKIPYTRGGNFKGKLTLAASGMPANITAPVLTINPNATSGEYEIKLTSNTPTGTYTFHFSGLAEQVDYSRNPEAAEAAAARKKEVDQIAVETAAAAQAAATAQAAAAKAATDAEAMVAAADQAKTAAMQALEQAQQTAAQAAEQLKQATAQANAKPDDAAAKAALAAAQKAVTDAQTQVQTATATLEKATKDLEAAQAVAKLAQEQKAKADEEAAAAAERDAAAKQLKAETDKRATDTANAAKPKKINVPVVSTPVTLKITPAPITLQPVAAATVKQGEKTELTVPIQRLYGFTAAVQLRAVPPAGVAGLSIPNSQVPANQAQAKVAVNAAANATPGKHEFRLIATMNLNGQNLTIEQPVTVTVQETPPAAAN